MNDVRQDGKFTGPFFSAFRQSFPTFPARFPLVLGAWRRVLPYSGMFYGARWVLWYGTELPWILSREKTPLNPRRSGLLLGLTGIRSSSTNCSSRDRCVSDWTNSGAVNSLFEHQFQGAWLVGDLWRLPRRPSDAGQRAERALPEAAVAQNPFGCQLSVGSCPWALGGEYLADDRPPGSVTRGVTLVVGALELRQVSFDQSIKGRGARLARAIDGGGRAWTGRPRQGVLFGRKREKPAQDAEWNVCTAVWQGWRI